jgi:hypothetical protein
VLGGVEMGIRSVRDRGVGKGAATSGEESFARVAELSARAQNDQPHRQMARRNLKPVDREGQAMDQGHGLIHSLWPHHDLVAHESADRNDRPSVHAPLSASQAHP